MAEEEKKGNRKGRRKGRRRRRETVITLPDGTQTTVPNYVDWYDVRNADLEMMLGAYAHYGTAARRFWEASTAGDARRQENDEGRIMDQDMPESATQRILGMNRQAMDPFRDYRNEMGGRNFDRISALRELNRNYMRQIRAASRIHADRMQRNIDIAALGAGGGAGGGGGGGGGGGRRSGGSGSGSGSGTPAPATENAPSGQYEAKYPWWQPIATAEAMGIDQSNFEELTSQTWFNELSQTVDAGVMQGNDPSKVIGDVIAKYIGAPGVDVTEVNTAVQLLNNHYRIVQGRADPENLAPRVVTDNTMEAFERSMMSDEDYQRMRETEPVSQPNSMADVDNNLRNLANQGLNRQNDEALAQANERSARTDIGNALSNLSNLNAESVTEPVRENIANFANWFNSDSVQNYNTSDLMEDIKNQAGQDVDVWGNIQPSLELFNDVAGFFNPFAGARSDEGREDDRLTPAGERPEGDWGLKPVRGADGVMNIFWVRDSDGFVYDPRTGPPPPALPKGRLPAPPSTPATPEGLGEGSQRGASWEGGSWLGGGAKEQRTPTLEPISTEMQWLLNGGAPEHRRGDNGSFWDSADGPSLAPIPENLNALLNGVLPAGRLPAPPATTPTPPGLGVIPQATNWFDELMKRMEEDRLRNAEQRSSDRPVQGPAAPTGGTRAPTPARTDPFFANQANNAGTVSIPGFQLAPLKKQEPAIQSEIDRLIARFG